MNGKETPPRSASLPAGYDETDPYEGEELSAYPDWWQANIAEFREFGMRPYLPPRFVDGAAVPELISTLEAELGVKIELRAVDPSVTDDWTVRVNKTAVTEIERNRTPSGRTEYMLNSTEFERIIRHAVSEEKV